ncbi:PREDICTED: glysoja_008139 partial [Prunus dulcis]|uniref:PREDICTED: glysoja_008139 partial n=1 Tax=Prunus dulcis TaxID=3755 RepID=A0A5E4FXF9_PRUDU|nr:PREDICTED: glysoja_008139 partial [Prunus dulcis]
MAVVEVVVDVEVLEDEVEEVVMVELEDVVVEEVVVMAVVVAVVVVAEPVVVEVVNVMVQVVELDVEVEVVSFFKMNDASSSNNNEVRRITVQDEEIQSHGVSVAGENMAEEAHVVKAEVKIKLEQTNAKHKAATNKHRSVKYLHVADSYEFHGDNEALYHEHRSSSCEVEGTDIEHMEERIQEQLDRHKPIDSKIQSLYIWDPSSLIFPGGL